jgi:hypothetical protein
VPYPPIPTVEDQYGSWSDCNQQNQVSAANNTYNEYLTQTVINLTTEQNDEVITNLFENSSEGTTPTLVTGAIALATDAQQQQMGAELVCAAVQGGALTGAVDIDPEAEETTLQLGCPGGESTTAKLTMGQDVRQLLQYPSVPQPIVVTTCLSGSPLQQTYNPALPEDEGQSQLMFSWIVNALAALLECCNPCPDTSCRFTKYLDGQPGEEHLPVPFAEYFWSAGDDGYTVRDAWLEITDIQFPVDTVMGPSNIGKYGRFYWIYFDENGTEVAGDTIYLDKLRNQLNFPPHNAACSTSYVLHSWGPVGFGYILSPGVTANFTAVPINSYVNLNAGSP